MQTLACSNDSQPMQNEVGLRQEDMVMIFTIEEHIRKAAIKCRKDFSCLEGNTECLCPVRTINGNHTVQIDPSSANFCKYCFHMEPKTYCLCPVRNELYNRYGI